MHPLAGTPAPLDRLIDVAELSRAYAGRRPDPEVPGELVSFGTSGHRGSPEDGTFNEAHILAITQAICEHRAAQGITGPLYVGKDTHAASRPAERTALEVLAATASPRWSRRETGTPPPRWSAARSSAGTPPIRPVRRTGSSSLRPTTHQGMAVSSTTRPMGGPADTDVTDWVQQRANALLREGNRPVRRAAPRPRAEDLVAPYVEDLAGAIDLEAIRKAGLRIGVDPMGGASVGVAEIAARYGLDLTVVNDAVDPTFRFMTLDHDGHPDGLFQPLPWRDWSR